MKALFIGLTVFAVLSAVNLVILNIQVFRLAKLPIGIAAPPETPPTPPLPPPTTPSTPDRSCPLSCIEKIQAATVAAKLVSPTSAPVRVAAPTASTTTSGVKEFFIPLGTGTVPNTDWTDIPGAQAWVDSNQYTNIKSVAFEAATHTPDHNQFVYLRLYNETDKYILANSELYFENAGVAALKISEGISLGSGNKLYKVQMKTQLGFPTNLTNSRIHILTY